MNERIISFIENQSCANVCCIDMSGLPYCFTCYYVFDSESKVLFFKSSVETNHSKFLIENKNVAGTILPDKKGKLDTVGIQFQGTILNETDILAQNATELYHDKNPFARLMSGQVYVIKLDKIKMTDSTLGFGKKTLWNSKEV